MHLRAAATLITAQMVKIQLFPERNTLSSRYLLDWADTRFLVADDKMTMSLLLSAFVWFDVLACVSTGEKPFLQLDHVSLLENGSLDLEELTGCQNWVIVSMLKVHSLSHWKGELGINKSLSISQLVERGNEIEAFVRGRLKEELTEDISLANGSSEVDRGEALSSTRRTITEIYAWSTLTYLHTIVSGANPHIPEIQESVLRTVEIFETLNDARLLRHLVWPFCISGCLATEEQQGVFRTLISNIRMSNSAVGTCLTAFQLMEECWKRRAVGEENYDWVSAMNSIGILAILA